MSYSTQNNFSYADFIRNRITQLRLMKNVSEYQMSYDLGKSKGYIQSISSGATLPSMEAFLDICSYLDVSPTEFFDVSLDFPEQVRETMNIIKKMPEDDLSLLNECLKRYHQLTK